MRAGIAFVHQELNLFDNLDVAANVFIGREPRRGRLLNLVDNARMRADVAPLPAAARRQLHARHAGDQAVAGPAADGRDRQGAVASMPAWSSSTSRPRACPSPKPKNCSRSSPALKAEGIAVIFISHRLHEIERACDRVVVLRDGVLAGTLDQSRDHPRPPGQADDRPRPQGRLYAAARRPAARSCSRLRNGSAPPPIPTRDVEPRPASRRNPRPRRPRRLRPHRTCARLFGIDPIYGGTLSLDGAADPTSRSADDAVEHGIFLVPEDRKGAGILLDLPIAENISLPNLPAYARSRHRLARHASASRPSAAARSRHQGARCATPHRLALGRQPAEGRARQVARHGAAGHDLRRADPRHRYRRQGGDLPADARRSPTMASPC